MKTISSIETIIRITISLFIIALMVNSCQSIPQNSVPLLIQANRQSIVKIVSIKTNESGQKKPIVIGTGFVVETGIAVTAAHVVKKYQNGSFYLLPEDQNELSSQNIAHIVAIEYTHDLALITSQVIDNLPPMQIGTSNDFRIGEDALILGFPLNDPTLTASKGMLSAISEFALSDDDPKTTTRMIKIDASINKGNSGGPIIHIASGKVIGVVCLKAGTLSNKLKVFRAKKPKARIKLSGDDPIELLKHTITEMEYNLQLGLGYGVNTSYLIDLLAKHK